MQYPVRKTYDVIDSSIAMRDLYVGLFARDLRCYTVHNSIDQSEPWIPTLFYVLSFSHQIAALNELLSAS